MMTILNRSTIFPLLLLGFLTISARVAAGRAEGVQAGEKSLPPRYSAPARPRLEREVRHELIMLPFYSVFDNLEFKVEGYRVTLLGQVVRPTLKADAEAVVKKIEGVDSVVNKIQVLPPSPSDDRIRLAIYHSIYSHPGLDRYALQAIPPIHIIVDNGNVTLVGVVANEMDKNLAYLQARGVAGTFSVTNKLRVEK